MAEIAERLDCSQNKVAYWMEKYGIPRRDISEAIYQWTNPDGDPFEIREPISEEERDLFRLALGLYVGEGKKKSGADISLSNTDPRIIQVFLRFLREICRVEESKIWAWINVYDDVDLTKAQQFWQATTGLPNSQFYKPVVRPRRGGTYLNVSEVGTLTVGVSNTRLRKIVLRWCDDYLNNTANMPS